MKYLTEDGEAIEGASPQELAIALRDGSRFASRDSLEDYMEGFADRLREFNNREIRYATPGEFIHDLIAIGYLQEAGE